MLDKTKVYSGFATPRKPGASPSANLRRVMILFEDDISYYVESQTEDDNAGHGIRRSVKKHCYELVEYRLRLKHSLCQHDVQEMDDMILTLFSITKFIRGAATNAMLRKMYDLLRCDY